MEKLLDANAVLRYLLEDIQEQSDCVAETIEAGAEVTVEVLAECVYVLSGVYHVSRSDIAESLGILLDEVTCRRKRVAAAALGLYSGSSFDFVDCVLAAEVAENGRETLTFDKKLQSLFSHVA
ncbi:PIN domain-containing protein [Enorma massiliensis]|uniref:PIN domain-containing protein n=1 Tax=Enorma massiliensis TaxID=1472761 RepID=UPI001958CEF9|nr:PIN domain-containing protein [Enorma massiliensis]MBM6892157.1 PIN domain-containing protein [Enorma massiliensis]